MILLVITISVHTAFSTNQVCDVRIFNFTTLCKIVCSNEFFPEYSIEALTTGRVSTMEESRFKIMIQWTVVI